MSPEPHQDPRPPKKRGRSSRSSSPSPRAEEADPRDPPPERENGTPASPPGGEEEADGGDAMNRAGLLTALRSGLEEALPGLRLLDRDLQFEEGARADLAGTDPGGRLVLVLLADEDVDRTALRVLDTHSYACRHTATIARHLAEERMDAGAEPRTVVIDAHSSDRLLRRLSPLFRAGVELYGLQSIRSAAGERSYLVPRGVEAAATSAPGVDPATTFLASLPSGLATLGGLAVQRLSRLDRDLVAKGTPGSMVWSFRDDVLVRLEHAGGKLAGSVGPRFDKRNIAEEADLDPLLESALARIVQAPEFDDELEPEGRGARPAEDFPILTAEEIEYFRD